MYRNIVGWLFVVRVFVLILILIILGYWLMSFLNMRDNIGDDVELGFVILL